MPLDAQDKVTLERLDRLLEKAAARAKSIPVRQSLREGGYLFAKALLEISTDPEWRTEVVGKLREITTMVASLPIEDSDQPAADTAEGDPAD